MQHVVDALVAALLATRPLHRCDTGRLLHHAHHALIAYRAAAVRAGVHIRHVIANRTQTQTGLEPPYRIGQRFGVPVGRTQDVEGKALRALGAHPGQLLQLFNQPGHRLGIAGHAVCLRAFKREPRLPRVSGALAKIQIIFRTQPAAKSRAAVHSLQLSPGIFNPPSMPCTLDLMAASALRPASLIAATTRSSSISTSGCGPLSPATAAGSMRSFSNSFLPFMVALIAPPPLEPSTIVSASL